MKLTTLSNSTVVSIPRFIHVVESKGDADDLRVQTASDSGKLAVYKVTRAIFAAVLGSTSGSEHEFRNLGLRKLTRVKFRGHVVAGVLVAVDIVPNRMYTRGAAPVEFGRALSEGFEALWNADISGFDVRSGYSGMDDKTLYRVLDALRDHTWAKGKNSVVLEGHRIEKVESDLFRIKPLAPKGSFQAR
jgi:hypothetical protein